MKMQMKNIVENSIEMKISTKMQHSLHVLQMSNLELVDFINEKALENIVLEVEQPEIVYDFQDYRHNNKLNKNRAEFRDEPYKGADLPNHYDAIKRLIFEQMPVSCLECKRCVQFLEYLIQNITIDGYLDVELDEAAIQFDISYKKALSLLMIIQHLEPVGLGARSVKECMLIQIEQSQGKNSLAYKMVNECQYFLETKNLKAVSDYTDTSLEEVKEALQFIKTLKPRPLATYIPTRTEYVVPDLMITQENEQFVVKVNKRCMPKVKINNPYANLPVDRATKKFVKQHVTEAQELIQNLAKREDTLLKIGIALIDRQIAFILQGLSSMKPMKLQDLAEQIGVHQSTISRAIRHKYIQTPQGIFELNALFTTAIETVDGNVISAQAIKQFIMSFIQMEDKRKPLSDQKIGELLNTQGISISRRTVAKYREALGIVSSVERVAF